MLHGEQKWVAVGSKIPSRYIVVDDVDSKEGSSKSTTDLVTRTKALEPLISSLRGDPTHISLLAGHDLELLSDMDPESLADIVPDRWVGPHMSKQFCIINPN